MIGQNILKNYGSKLDLKIDNSETYDFILDKSEWTDLVLDNSDYVDFVIEKEGWVDLVLDYSEFYDFQLDYSKDIQLPIVYDSIVNSNLGCDFTILTQDGYLIHTQNDECIQYQH